MKKLNYNGYIIAIKKDKKATSNYNILVSVFELNESMPLMGSTFKDEVSAIAYSKEFIDKL